MISGSALAGLGTACLLLIGYFGQMYWPAPKAHLMGIDLGTTYSCVGYYRSSSGKNANPEYILVKVQRRDRVCIPSIVAFKHKSTHDSALIGYPALEAMLRGDQDIDVIYDTKRFIGRHFPTIGGDKTEFDRYPFKIHINQLGQPLFELSDKRRISPEYIGSLIIKELRRAAENQMKGSFKACVMAVPAEFDDFQRNATARCATALGLHVSRIINEPTAAALAYGLHHRSIANTLNVIVIDVGGGTTDVSIMRVENSMFLTIAMAGHRRLGGQDFTKNLMNLIRRKCSNLPHHYWLQSISEQCKRNLSLVNECNINFNSTVLLVTRAEFEEVNKEVFQKIIEPINAVLASANITDDQVDDVVLVGGSSRIPRIRQIISDRFHGSKLNCKIDPDTTVVYGLAIQAGIIGRMWPIRVSATEVESSVKKVEL